MRISRKALVPGALYHVVQRGQDRCTLFLDDCDRREFLWVLGTALLRYEAQAWAYCLMDNHVHLLLRDVRCRLPDVMKFAFGNYARRLSERRRREGHVFQGRPRVFCITDERYLSEVIRYIVRNPVKAGIVRSPLDWPWSSHRAMAGLAPVPRWLARDPALEACGNRVDVYLEHVHAGIDAHTVRWERIGRPV